MKVRLRTTLHWPVATCATILMLLVTVQQFEIAWSRPIPQNADSDEYSEENSTSHDSLNITPTITRNPCRLIGDSTEWAATATLVPLDGKPLVVVSHTLFDVSDGIVPAITYQVSVTIPLEHEFTLEYFVIGLKEDATHSKHRHQRERKHDELIQLDVAAMQSMTNSLKSNSNETATGSSLDNEVVICSKNSIGSFKSSVAPSNTFTFDWYLMNSPGSFAPSTQVSFRFRLKSSSDSTNTILEQVLNVNTKPDCNLKLNLIKETQHISMSSLWNSHADNFGLTCTLMLIPRPSLGLEIVVSNLSIHGVREMCTERYLSFSANRDLNVSNEESGKLPANSYDTHLPASSIKFCGKLEDYSVEERTLTFTPQIKRKSIEADSDLSEVESGSASDLFVLLKIRLPGLVKSRETFSLQLNSLNPCQKVFLPELSGTLKYQVNRFEFDELDENTKECSIIIHVPYGNTILTELSVLRVQYDDETGENNTMMRTSQSIELSPLDSINLENSIIVDPSLREEESGGDCAQTNDNDNQLEDETSLLIRALDLGANKVNYFCFDSSSSADIAIPSARVWNSKSNQLKLTFTLRYFNQIIISYKATPISEVTGNCDEGWVKVESSGCVLLVEKPETWLEAEKSCQKQRAHLLTVRNEYASQEIEKLLTASPWFNPGRGYWIGANDRESEGNFQWSSGLPFIYSNWFTGWWQNGKEILTAQPNDDGLSRQDCVELRDALSSITYSRFQTRIQHRMLSPSNATFMDKDQATTNEQSNLVLSNPQLRFHWNDRNCDARNFYICEKEIERDEEILCNQTIHFGLQQLSPVTITSPSYPSTYPDNIACFITIETLPNYKVLVNFDEFVLEESTGCNYDSLELTEPATGESKNDKVTRLCGDWTPKLKLLRYVSNSSTLTFKFESDFSHHFAGFRATVSTEKDTKHECSDQQMLTFESHCYLFVSSPAVTWKSAHQTCTSLKGNLASILSFDEWNFVTKTLVSNSNFDKRSMYWLGGSIDQSNQLVWTDRMPFNFSAFHQSDLQSLADWKCLSLYWHRGPKEMFAWKLSDCKQASGYICKKNKQGDGKRNPLAKTFSGTGGKLASINFPSNYYDKLDYTNHLVAPQGTRIIIRFTHLDLEQQADCLYDYVEFIDRKTKNTTRVCGSHQEAHLDRFDFLSTSNEVDIKFHSDYADNFSGFELVWTAIDVTSCLSEKRIILTGTEHQTYQLGTHQYTIHTPNFPYFNLRGVNCVFTVVAPVGHRIMLSFEIFEIGRYRTDAGSEYACQNGDHVVVELGDKTFDDFSSNNATMPAENSEGFIRLCGNLTGFPHRTTLVSFQEKMRVQIISPQGRTGRGFLGRFKAIPMNFDERIAVPVEANSSFTLASLNYPLSPPNSGNLTMSFTMPPNYAATLRMVGVSAPNCHLSATSFLSFYDPYNGANGTTTIICKMKGSPLLLELEDSDNDSSEEEKTVSTKLDRIPKYNRLGFSDRNTLSKPSPAVITLKTTFNRFELTQTYRPEFDGEKWSAEIVSSLDEQFRAKVLAGGDRLLLLRGCTPNPCANNGQCVNEDNKHICRCQPPYTGPFCGLTLCDLNPCLFGQCVLEDKSFKCICQMGYGGERCDRNHRPCDEKPCTGHGECVELNNSTYKCHCFAFWEGPKCEDRMQNIPYKPLSERMLKEPFWLGIITVFVVLGVIGLVFCLRRHFPEKLEKLLNEDLDKTRGISWVSGRSPSSLGLGGCGAYRESIAGTSQQSTSPVTTRSFLGRFGIRKPSLLSLSSANSAISVTATNSPHKYETRTFSLDDLLKPSRSMMMRTPSPHRRRNFSIHGRRDPVEKQQILQQLVSSSIHSSLDGEKPRKPTIGEIIQMSERRLRLASLSSMQQTEAALSPSPSVAAEVETSFIVPLTPLTAQQKAEKKVTFARLLDKLTAKEISSSSSCSDISCPEDKIVIPLKLHSKKDRKGRFRRSKSYHRTRTSETESVEGVEMSSSDTTPDPIYTPKFPSRICISPTGLSVSATNSPTPKQSKSLSKIPSADSLLALFRRFSGSSSAPPSPQYSENEESSISATPLSTPGSPRDSNLSLNLNIRPPAFRITTSEPTTVEVPVIDAQSNASWRSAQQACITLEVPLRDYCLSPIHEVPTPLPTPSHSPANSPMMQRQQPSDAIPVIQIQASSEAEGDDEHNDEREARRKQAPTGFSSLPFSIKSFEIPVISFSTEDDLSQQTVVDPEMDEKICKFGFGRRRRRGSESEMLPDVLIHVPPDVPSESGISDESPLSPGPYTPMKSKNKPPPLVFANEILSYVKKDTDKDFIFEVPVLNVETATPIADQTPPILGKLISDKPDHLPDLMPHLKQSSWDPHPITPPVIMINQNSEPESDSDTVVRRTLLRPNLTFLSPFAGGSDRVASESNLSTSGYSSMASPCPSRCPSISPLCPLELEDHLNNCQGCCKCGHHYHFRRSSLTPCSSRKSSLSTSRRCSLNGAPIFTSHLYENSEMNFNENSEINLKDWNNDSAVETDQEHEPGNFQPTELQSKMSPISEEMKSIYTLLDIPPKNFPKSQSLDMGSTGKQKTRLKGESLDSKLNSIDPTAFEAMFSFNIDTCHNETEHDIKQTCDTTKENQQKFSPISSRSDSPLSDLGAAGTAKLLQVGRGILTPGTDTDGVYDCPSSEVPGNNSTFDLQNISPEQELRRSGRRRNRRMSAGTQNKNLLGVNQKSRERKFAEKESPEKMSLLPAELHASLSKAHHGLNVAGSSGNSKRASPKRRIRARVEQANNGSTSSSSIESLNSLRSNRSCGGSSVALASPTSKSKADVNPSTSDKSPRTRPKISRLKTISLQIRFLRRLEQNLTRKKESLATFTRDSGRRFSNDSRKDSTSSCTSASTCGSSCSCTGSCEECKNYRLNPELSVDESEEEVEVDRPLLGSSKQFATNRNAQRVTKAKKDRGHK